MKERNLIVDITRGLALFWVILGHLVSTKSVLFKWIFSFHMPLFFFLSGMLFNHNKYKNFRSFLKQKLKKRVLPYFFFIYIAIIISLIIPSWRMQVFNIDVIKEIFYNTQPEQIHIGQIWFLIALFFAEIILYIINKIFDKYKRNKYLIIIVYMIMFLIGSNILKILSYIELERLPFKIDTAIIASVFMGLGYEINKSNLLKKLVKNQLIYGILFLLVGFILSQYNETVNICNCCYNNILLFLSSALCGILGMYLIGTKINKNKYLEFFGKNSLFIFATHAYLIFIYTNILSEISDIRITMMYNIPNYLCIIGAIIIYNLFYPITILYNKIRERIEIQFNN